MVGIGGILGSLFGGYLTNKEADHWCFAIRSLVGLAISLTACTMNKSVEKDPFELINVSVSARSKSNLKDIW